MKNLKIFLTLLLLSSLSLTAQNKDTQTADKYFARYDFNQAIEAYDKLVNQVDTYQHTTINEYAATNPAEFFAVTSEYFFTTPETLKKCCPEVYKQLVLFYKQDSLR